MKGGMLYLKLISLQQQLFLLYRRVKLMKTLQEIMDLAKNSVRQKIAVAVAQDKDVLQAVEEARQLGLVDVCLVGDCRKISGLAKELEIDVSDYEIIDEADDRQAVRTAVALVGSGDADMLMKGMVHTAELLRAVLDKETGLRQGGRILSLLSLFESEHYHKLLFVTDAGINIAPDLKQKVDILQNAAETVVSLGIDKPKAAVLAPVEMVNPDIQSTLDAAALSKMADREQIKDCIVDGPLAMDIAINMVAASHKGIRSDVAGDADILLVPNIDAGNILHKTMIFLDGSKSCGIVVGARAPIVLTSRSESALSKLYAIGLASAVSAGMNRINPGRKRYFFVGGPAA
jgi:phosphate butyryltransferase